jgi:hypothetical protein
MDRDDIIRLAREAGFDQTGLASFTEFTARIERFAALVVEHEIYQIGQDRITLTGHLKHLLDHVMEVAAQREREACAKVCEEEIKRVKPIYSVTAENCVKAIRARGKE